MTEREMERAIMDLTKRLAEAERTLGRLPVRTGKGGGSGSTTGILRVANEAALPAPPTTLPGVAYVISTAGLYYYDETATEWVSVSHLRTV